MNFLIIMNGCFGDITIFLKFNGDSPEARDSRPPGCKSPGRFFKMWLEPQKSDVPKLEPGNENQKEKEPFPDENYPAGNRQQSK